MPDLNFSRTATKIFVCLLYCSQIIFLCRLKFSRFRGLCPQNKTGDKRHPKISFLTQIMLFEFDLWLYVSLRNKEKENPEEKFHKRFISRMHEARQILDRLRLSFAVSRRSKMYVCWTCSFHSRFLKYRTKFGVSLNQVSRSLPHLHALTHRHVTESRNLWQKRNFLKRVYRYILGKSSSVASTSGLKSERLTWKQFRNAFRAKQNGFPQENIRF